MANGDHPPGSEPFDVTLHEGFELGAPIGARGEAKQAGCTIERDGALFVVRDDWTENEDHAAWLVATNVGVPLESVTVGLGAERSGANGVTPAHDGDDFTRSSLHRNSRPGGRCPKRRGALRIMRLAGARA